MYNNSFGLHSDKLFLWCPVIYGHTRNLDVYVFCIETHIAHIVY